MTRDELVDRIGGNPPPDTKPKDDNGAESASGESSPPVKTAWLKPLDSYDRQERREYQVTRFHPLADAHRAGEWKCKCIACGADLARDAKACPKCEAKTRQYYWIFSAALVALLALLVVYAIMLHPSLDRMHARGARVLSFACAVLDDWPLGCESFGRVREAARREIE